MTRAGAPEGSRIEYYGKQESGRPPFFRDYSKEEQTWKILDALKTTAEELGNSLELKVYCGVRVYILYV